MTYWRAILMGIAFGVGVAIVLSSDWLAGRSTSTWWVAVPWLLIVAIWAFIIERIRRQSGKDPPAAGAPRNESREDDGG
jgi:hypothetical protein